MVKNVYSDFETNTWHTDIGNTMGYPGVFQGNPCPYPSKPAPGHMGVGFEGNGLWVWVHIHSSCRCDSMWQYSLFFPPLPHSHSLVLPIYSTTHIACHLIARNLSDSTYVNLSIASTAYSQESCWQIHCLCLSFSPSKFSPLLIFSL